MKAKHALAAILLLLFLALATTKVIQHRNNRKQQAPQVAQAQVVNKSTPVGGVKPSTTDYKVSQLSPAGRRRFEELMQVQPGQTTISPVRMQQIRREAMTATVGLEAAYKIMPPPPKTGSLSPPEPQVTPHRVEVACGPADEEYTLPKMRTLKILQYPGGVLAAFKPDYSDEHWGQEDNWDLTLVCRLSSAGKRRCFGVEQLDSRAVAMHVLPCAVALVQADIDALNGGLKLAEQ